MQRTFQFTINPAADLMPIGLYLKSMGFSSQNIIALKKVPESILLNGKWEYTNTLLHTGDVLTVHISETTSSPNISPVYYPLDIVYEDNDILVINKPANMPIHPSQNNHENTLANGVAYYFASQNIPYVFRCINRLDRDTTGLTILAKHMLSGNLLSHMVASRNIKREYLAIVHGLVTPETGVIDAPIARVPGSTIERYVNYETGERAVTHYRKLKESPKCNLSLLSLWLETGRTHQIRVHMKHLGYPLIGDYLYYPDFTYIGRQALHSHRLTFRHPITKEPMQFMAPVPDDMNGLF